MARQKTNGQLIHGTATHRRTEGDYLRVLLDTVTLDDWRDVVANTLQAAKQGNAAARGWLAQYLIGKPEAKAPSPLTVVVQQLSGNDPVVDRLAKPVIARAQFPCLDDAMEDRVRALVAAELAEKLPPPPVGAGLNCPDRNST